MSKYCAHIAMYVKFKDGKQDKYPIWENVYLIVANDEESALQKAQIIGKRISGDSDGSFYWGDRSAEWVFAGVRKLISCSDDELDDGIELTYSEFEAKDEHQIQSFSSGKPVDIKYVE